MSGHCEGVCAPDTMVCALVHGSIREVRRGWQSQKSLIFMHFHGVLLGSQHEIWSKQHNGKVNIVMTGSDDPAVETEAMALGADAFFQKPLGFQRFLALGDLIKVVVFGHTHT